MNAFVCLTLSPRESLSFVTIARNCALSACILTLIPPLSMTHSNGIIIANRVSGAGKVARGGLKMVQCLKRKMKICWAVEFRKIRNQELRCSQCISVRFLFDKMKLSRLGINNHLFEHTKAKCFGTLICVAIPPRT
jgi:hypothetical protein